MRMKAAESSIFVINITGKGKGFNCENFVIIPCILLFYKLNRGKTCQSFLKMSQKIYNISTVKAVLLSYMDG